jgi:thioredoxin-like negative regulator of GroEL
MNFIKSIPPRYARDANALMAAAPSLVFVGVKWCRHCQNALPVLKDVASIIGTVVPTYYVDAEKEPKLAASLGVDGYPTILFVNNNGTVKFEGERTVDAIVGFVCKHSSRNNKFCMKK